MWRVHVNKSLDTIFIESIDESNIVLNSTKNSNQTGIVNYKFVIAKGNNISFYSEKESDIYNNIFNKFENENQDSRTLTLINFDDVKLLLDQSKLIRFLHLNILLK